ncbi:NAD(P)-binding domain-containing protein [Streptomyces sp. NPDC091271]|uniref:NAD(P)-binding domain-containing protein n=1 Tax=Streptomyces sp. NPDC091271 TaxID=3365980 RepID=UPI003826C32A
MTPKTTPRAGVVGLGMIGGGVAVSLARSGQAPAVFDVRPDASDQLPGVPGVLASPAEVAASSDVVMVAVVNAAQARQAITGEDGILSAARPGSTVVLLSTVALPVVRELAAACTEREVGFLDCGVTPGDKAAEHGMVAIVGGDAAVVESARPVLAGWAKRIVHCGPSGAGMATKIARNVVTYGTWRTVHEAAALASAAGVDPGRLAEVIEAADPDGRTLLQLLGMRGEDGNLPDAVARQISPLMTKDLDAALALAEDLGVSVPGVGVSRERAAETLGQQPAEEPGSAQAVASEPSAEADKGPDAVYRRGLELMDQVYGPGFSDAMPKSPVGDPFMDATVNYLFGEVWSRPALSVRDRRLLVLGATAALGRSDLIRIQTEGALINGELDAGQLREAALHLALYVGWGNATAVRSGFEEAIAAQKDATPPQN